VRRPGAVDGAVDVELNGSAHRLAADSPESFADALRGAGADIRVQSLTVQPQGGTDRSLVVYAECAVGGETVWGVGLGADESSAAVSAVAGAVNRAAR
jgi:2-isopropylmalate synthase